MLGGQRSHERYCGKWYGGLRHSVVGSVVHEIYFSGQNVVLFRDSFTIVLKSCAYCSTLQVSCLKYDTAWRFSTWAVRSVARFRFSNYWGIIHLTSVSWHSPFFSSSSDYCVLLETVHSVLWFADLGLRFLRSFTLATLVCIFCLACSSVIFSVDCPLAGVYSESVKQATKHFQKFPRSGETWHNLDWFCQQQHQ